MNDGIGGLLLVVFGLGLIVGFATGDTAAQDRYQNAAIERGYALYCSNTGDFSWKDECE